MDERQEVSLDVSLNVSLEAGHDDAPFAAFPPRAAEAPALPANREDARSGPGRYLVRSGSVYLFQIRMPRELAGGRCRTVRIGLGALTAREARRQADLLGALARNRFDQIRAGRMDRELVGENGEQADGVIFDSGTPEMTAAEIKGYLKAMRQVIAQPAPPTPPHQVPAFAGLKGLVEINRELAKGASGNPLIVDNAEMLKAQSIERITGAASATQEAAPAQDRPAASLVPEASPAAVPSPEAYDTEARIDATRPSAGANAAPGAARVPAFKLDRRHVPRKVSDKPLFSEVAEEYFAEREAASGEGNKDIGTARFRAKLFVELIGDHPVDTYTAADLQAFIYLLTHWPASAKDRPAGKSAHEILADNADLTAKPLKLNALRNGYVAIVKSILNSRTAAYEYDYPFKEAKLRYPKTAEPAQAIEPISDERLNAIFRIGVGRGLLDEAMLPLLGRLTSRRLGLLVHLQGNDVWPALRLQVEY